MQFKPVMVKLSFVVHEATNMVKKLAAEKQISITAHFNLELTLTADEEMLQTIIRNLVSHAVKNISNEDKLSYWQSKNEATTTINIRVNGAGISKGILDSLFNSKTTH